MGIISYIGTFFASPPPSQKFSDRFVLVTGCDSGLGTLIAKALNMRGYHVFAGCPTEAAFKELILHEQSPTFRPFLLDVTKEGSIQHCARWIAGETKEKGLFALINNVGCNEGFVFEFTSDEQIEKTMEMNFMGPIKIIKALLPSLRQNIQYNHTKPAKEQDISPRIIHIGSVLGRITIPFYGAYSASKHALEAMLDTIRVELLPWKIHIAIIEPGAIKSRTHSDRIELSKRFFLTRTVTEQTFTLYGEEYIHKVIDFWEALNTGHDDTKEVVRCVVDAVEVGFPKDRYVIGTLAKTQVMMHKVLPRWMIDLAWGSTIRLLGMWPKGAKELEDETTIERH